MSSISCNTKKPWTVAEDHLLSQLVHTHGTNNWTALAELITERTGKQCRERWHNHLNPEIKKGEWSENEDQMIMAMQRQLGNQWAKIAKYLPGRSDNAVKNRFHAIIRARASQVPTLASASMPMEGVLPTSTTQHDSFVPIATAAPMFGFALVEIKKEKDAATSSAGPLKVQPSTVAAGSFYPVNFLEAVNPLQLFASSAWSSSGQLKAASEVIASMQTTNVNFDQYMHSQASSSLDSESPVPSIMSLSPVTVDEEFLDYWGLSEDAGDAPLQAQKLLKKHSSRDMFFNVHSDKCDYMEMEAEVMMEAGNNGFDFGF